MADEDDFLREMGLDEGEITAIGARARERVRAGRMADVRPVLEDGDPDIDIAASRRRDLGTG